MKTLKIISVLLFALILDSKGMAQSSEREIRKEFYRADGIVSMIINYLPSGWKFYESQGRFIIEYADSVYILNENRVNVPAEDKIQREKRIREHGKKGVSRIVIVYEPRWDILRVQEAGIKNTAISDQIRGLYKKYDMASLADQKLSRKDAPVYKARNVAEQARLDGFYREKALLESQLIRVPDYHTELYSLFVIEKCGYADEITVVSPEEASLGLYKVLALLREVCGK